MRKPDATTTITRDNYKSLVWPLPVGDLLYVGPSTARKLNDKNVLSIGDLASWDDDYLRSWFGKLGLDIGMFARGHDVSPVAHTVGDEGLIKSIATAPPRPAISSTTTTPRS